MAGVQAYYQEFHSEILLSDKDGKANLPKKRETLISNLKDGLKKWAKEDDERSEPKFESFNQGSYAMYTGMKPVNDDYDIDVGIIFDATKSDWACPVELKKVVRSALKHNSRTVNIRRPCVTVEYQGDKSSYHVDLAIYIKSRLWDGKLYIAKGLEGSSEDKKVWEQSDPKGLICAINDKFAGDDRKQFKRCIRYLKRWRDIKFSSNSRVISIALTCAAYHWFVPSKLLGEYNDNSAMLDLANRMIDNFNSWDNDRLTVKLPISPSSNLLEKMTDKQMADFKTKLEKYRDALQSAKDADSKEDAVQFLQSEYGDEFPDYSGKDNNSAESGSEPYIATGNAA